MYLLHDTIYTSISIKQNHEISIHFFYSFLSLVYCTTNMNNSRKFLPTLFIIWMFRKIFTMRKWWIERRMQLLRNAEMLNYRNTLPFTINEQLIMYFNYFGCIGGRRTSYIHNKYIAIHLLMHMLRCILL